MSAARSIQSAHESNLAVDFGNARFYAPRMALKEVNPMAELNAFCAKYRLQKEAAAALGISPNYLSDLLLGRRDFSATLLTALNLREVVVRKTA